MAGGCPSPAAHTTELPAGAVCGAGQQRGPGELDGSRAPLPALGCVCVMNRVLFLRLLWAASEFLCFTLSSLKVEQRGLVGKELRGLSLPCGLIVRKGDLHPGI